MVLYAHAIYFSDQIFNPSCLTGAPFPRYHLRYNDQIKVPSGYIDGQAPLHHPSSSSKQLPE